jgi:hypothetical protein
MMAGSAFDRLQLDSRGLLSFPSISCPNLHIYLPHVNTNSEAELRWTSCPLIDAMTTWRTATIMEIAAIVGKRGETESEALLATLGDNSLEERSKSRL